MRATQGVNVNRTLVFVVLLLCINGAARGAPRAAAVVSRVPMAEPYA